MIHKTGKDAGGGLKPILYRRFGIPRLCSSTHGGVPLRRFFPAHHPLHFPQEIIDIGKYHRYDEQAE